MKTLAGLFTLLACAYGQDGPHPPRADVLVQVENPSAGLVLVVARVTADRILETAGVRLRWSFGRSGRGQKARTIVVRLEEPTSAELPGAMARAWPFAFGSVQVNIFPARVLAVFPGQPASGGKVLGHVLAHEIIHVLQGATEHSESELMRPHWSAEDLLGMAARPFLPSAKDTHRIHQGLIAWGRRELK